MFGATECVGGRGSTKGSSAMFCRILVMPHSSAERLGRFDDADGSSETVQTSNQRGSS